MPDRDMDNPPTTQMVEQARELLAAEYDAVGADAAARTLRAGKETWRTECALRAIESALARPSDGPGAREEGVEAAAQALEAWADGFIGGETPGKLRAAAADLRTNMSAILFAALNGKLGDG